MSITNFLRLLWARRGLIVLATLVCTIIGIVTVQVVRPRYETQSRVMLDVIKPDPVTGQVLATAFLRAYTKTQLELVKDQPVARRVVDDLKFASDPDMLRAYRNRSGDTNLDFQRWAVQQVMDGADARLIEGSNILEIGFSSDSPFRARQVADALRKAYISMTLETRQQNARRNAEWYETQSQKIKAILFQAEMSKAAFERESGIVLQDDKVDVDTARLRALAMQGPTPIVAAPASVADAPSAAQLVLLDGEIAEAAKNLGPNHPQLLQMKRRRDALAAQAVREGTAAAAAAAAAYSGSQVSSGMLEAQKARVLAQREKVERLRLMQDEINLRREQYSKFIARAGELRQEAEIAESGVVPLGAAITPQAPVFPKKGLMIAVSMLGGMGLGVVIAIGLELMGRRIRTAGDLASLVDAPVLAVIRSMREPPKKGLAGLKRRWQGLFGLLPRASRA